MSAPALSSLVDCKMYVWLVPVRNATGTHYTRRSSTLGIEAGPALCGAVGDLDAYQRPRFRRVHTAKTVCNTCHVLACQMPSRVSW